MTKDFGKGVWKQMCASQVWYSYYQRDKPIYYHMKTSRYSSLFRIIYSALLFDRMDKGHIKAVFYGQPKCYLKETKKFLCKFFNNKKLSGEMKQMMRERVNKMPSVKDRQAYRKCFRKFGLKIKY